MLREIVLDTETTGLKPADGHRIVEIGCVELRHYVATGEYRQWYLNPERDMPAEAEAIHGLSAKFLSDKPVFGEIVGEFLDFIKDSTLIIHNASFDIGFLNAELKRLGLPPLSRSRVVDTIALAREKFPGSPASLDALCKRFGIDNSNRTYHGALLDTQLLAEVYLELRGGRQTGFNLDNISTNGQADTGSSSGRSVGLACPVRPVRPPRPHAPTAEELAAHQAMVLSLKSSLWTR
jgi:DNA polymerase-3 subunit epsilon